MVGMDFIKKNSGRHAFVYFQNRNTRKPGTVPKQSAAVNNEAFVLGCLVPILVTAGLFVDLIASFPSLASHGKAKLPVGSYCNDVAKASYYVRRTEAQS